MVCISCEAYTDVSTFSCISCGGAPNEIDKSYRGNDFTDHHLEAAILNAGYGYRIAKKSSHGFFCVPQDAEKGVPFFLKLVTLDRVDPNYIYGKRVLFQTQITMNNIKDIQSFVSTVHDLNATMRFIRCDIECAENEPNVFSLLHLPTFFSIRDLIEFIEWCAEETTSLVNNGYEFT